MELVATNNLAAALSSDGKQGEAKPLYQRGIELARQARSQTDEAADLLGLASVIEKEGVLGEARGHAQAAATLYRTINDPLDLVDALDKLSEIDVRMDLAAEARKVAEESLALRKTSGVPPWSSLTMLATVALAEGHDEQAKSYARQSLDDLKTRGLPEAELYALDVLARVQVSDHDPAEFQKTAARERELAKQFEGAYVAQFIVPTLAVAQAKAGDVKGAVQRLRQAMMVAEKNGLTDVLYEQRRALVHLEADYGMHAEAKRGASELIHYAEAHGLAELEKDMRSVERHLR
jgi:hypothetical protein